MLHYERAVGRYDKVVCPGSCIFAYLLPACLPKKNELVLLDYMTRKGSGCACTTRNRAMTWIQALL